MHPTTVDANITAAVGNITTSLVTTMATKKLDYAPLTLAEGWAMEFRLCLTVLFSIIGTITNGFYFASFFIEGSLHMIGNIFMACAGLSDLIICCVIMPTVSVVLISGMWNTNSLCRFLQLLFESVNYAYNMFYALMATERYYWLCCSRIDYDWFISARLKFVCTSVYAISITAATVGVLFDLDYNYCDRTITGSFGYRRLSLIVFCAIPAVITSVRLVCCIVAFVYKYRSNVAYRRSEESAIDYNTCAVNIAVYAIYIMFWLPYLMNTMYKDYISDDATFYQNVWLGLSRSVFSALFYPIFVKTFRGAFVKLFYYCCCKKPLPASASTRRTMNVRYNVANNEVKIQMLPLAPLHGPPEITASDVETDV